MTEILHLNPQQPDPEMIRYAVDCMDRGGLIIYPTDTVYSIGGNILDREVIRKIFRAKNRPSDKFLHVVVESLTAAADYVEFDDCAEAFAQKYLPGPLTLILKRKKSIPNEAAEGVDTLGIRIPDNLTSLALAKMANYPFTTTSANESGRCHPYSVDEVFAQMGCYIAQIDLVLDCGPSPQLAPSSMLDLSCYPPKVLREGPISANELMQFYDDNRRTKYNSGAF